METLIKSIIKFLYLNVWDEEILGLHFESLARSVAKAIAVTITTAQLARIYLHRFEDAISPKLPVMEIKHQ